MTAWLVVNHFLSAEKYTELNHMLVDSAKRRNIDLRVRTNAELLSEFTIGGARNPERVAFVLFWDKDVTLCRMLEGMGLKVFNSSCAIAACDNKGLTHAVLQSAGIKMPQTIVAPLSFCREDMSAFVKNAAEKLSVPMIIKECFGSFGQQVYKADSVFDAIDIANSISPGKMIFQEFIAESAGRDVRINVVGGRVVAAMRRESADDFRANLTFGGKAFPYTPTEEETEIALRAAAALKLDFGGVDILQSDRGPLLCEVNSNAHIKNIFDCTKINVADEIFDFITAKLR